MWKFSTSFSLPVDILRPTACHATTQNKEFSYDIPLLLIYFSSFFWCVLEKSDNKMWQIPVFDIVVSVYCVLRTIFFSSTIFPFVSQRSWAIRRHHMHIIYIPYKLIPEQSVRSADRFERCKTFRAAFNKIYLRVNSMSHKWNICADDIPIC